MATEYVPLSANQISTAISKNPQTGETELIWITGHMLLLSTIGAAVVLTRKKQRK
jgi:LPXTG-motif cell wall-anchored protein